MKRIVWDQTKCTGCRVCEAICSFVNEGEFNPTKARCKVLHTVDRQIRYTIRVSCLQCEEAYCKAVCPAGAISIKDGVKIVDEDKCLGCKMCEIACPVGAIAVHPEKGVALKCDMCPDWDEPPCVKYCYSGALQLVPSETVGYALARAKSQKFLDMVKREA